MSKANRIALSERLGLAHADAAEYVGVSPAEFDWLVRTGAMPSPLNLYGELVWVRQQIDEARRAQGARGGQPVLQ